MGRYFWTLVWIGMATMQMAFSAPAIASTSDIQPFSLWHQANVLYLGEHHDESDDHQAELQIIEALYQQSPKLTLGLEMFQRPMQGILDQYLADEIDAQGLKTKSDFDNLWGYDWEFYAPILAFAKAKHIPVKALNTPLEVTRQVGQEGLQSLKADDFRWIPAADSLDLTNQVYRDRIHTAYDTYHQGQGNSRNFEHFYEAQILWDETMAEAIAMDVNRHPDRLMIALVGAGHIASDDGIPNRVKKRILLPQFLQYSVQLNPTDETAADLLQ